MEIQVPYPSDAPIPAKTIAYLYAYRRIEPQDIVARFPRVLSLARVHLALAHYYSNRPAIDAEIDAVLRFNRPGALSDPSMTLPAVKLASLVEMMNE